MNRSYLVAAPTAQILKEGMISALLSIGTDLGIIQQARGNPYTIKLHNGATIVARTARNPDLLRGGSYAGAVLDEAALLHPLAKEIILAVLRQRGKPGWMTYGSTPKGRANWLYAEVHHGRCELTKAHSKENPFVDAEQVDSLIASYDEHFRRQEIEGEFCDDDEATQVLPTQWVESAMQRGREHAQLPPLACLGVDTARGGAARFTIAYRHGSIIPRLTAYPGSSVKTSQQGAALVLKALENPQAVANLDISGGTGSGVFDLLNEQKIRARAVNFGAGIDKTDRTGRYKFANIRAWLYWSLREALDPSNNYKLSLPDSYELAAELTSVHWFMSGTGRIQLQPKEQIAKILRRSPDLADAVALTMFN